MGEFKTVWDVPHRVTAALRSPLYTNAVYLMLSQASMAGLGFVFWVIVARYYSEAELGYSSAIISTISLVALIGHMGLDSFLVRFLSGSENPRRLFNTCLTYTAVATAIAALIAAAGFRLWAPGIGFVARQPLFLAAFVAFAIVTALFSMAGFGFIGGRKAKYLLLKDVIFSVTKLFLPLLFVQHFHAFGVVASWGLATAAGLVASLAIFMPRMLPGYHPQPTMTARLVRRAWGFSGMSYLIILISTAPRFIMPLVVINLLGPEENAYFYVAWAIATLLFSIPGSLAQSLFAEGSHDKRKVARDVRRSVLMSVVLLLPAILFVWLLGSKMLLAFGGSYSERSIELLRILALAGIPITVERAYFAVLRIRGRLRELSLWRSLLTVVLITASYVLLPQMGLTAIGWVWLVTHSVMAILIILLRSAVWRGGRPTTPSSG